MRRCSERAVLRMSIKMKVWLVSRKVPKHVLHRHYLGLRFLRTLAYADHALLFFSFFLCTYVIKSRTLVSVRSRLAARYLKTRGGCGHHGRG
jgi:hypothetical protein